MQLCHSVLKTAVDFASELKSCMDMPRDTVTNLGSRRFRISLIVVWVEGPGRTFN